MELKDEFAVKQIGADVEADNPWWNWKEFIVRTEYDEELGLIILDGIESFSIVCVSVTSRSTIILDGIERNKLRFSTLRFDMLIILDGIERDISDKRVCPEISLKIILDGIESKITSFFRTTLILLIILDGIERQMSLTQIFVKEERDNPWWNWKMSVHDFDEVREIVW